VNCEICKTRPAKVHYTEIINNQMTKMNLCLECAEEKGVDVQKGSSFGLGDLVAGLIDTAVDADAERISKVRCPTCGFQYSDFKRIGRLGCPDCYDAFDSQLVSVLRHVHGSTQHTGKKASRQTEQLRDPRAVAALREELARHSRGGLRTRGRDPRRDPFLDAQVKGRVIRRQ
jgi:protein arginine kinase activator